MFKDQIEQIVQTHLKKEADKLGMTLEEYNRYAAEEEEKKRAERERYENSDQFKEEQRVEKERVEREKYEELVRLFQLPVDETIRATKTNLRKVIKWGSSRYNHWKKEDVVRSVLGEVESKANGISEYRYGAYSERAHTSYAPKNYSTQYLLCILNNEVRLIHGYGEEGQKVYQLKTK